MSGVMADWLLVGGPLDGATVEGARADTETGVPDRILIEGEDGWYAPGSDGTARWVEACECGTPLTEHPPLSKPRPWAHGRPCSRTARQRGYGWDGRPLVERNDRWKPQ